MAEIILEPGEVFEHLHGSPSQTVLLSGEVDFEMCGSVERLVAGRPVDVPANTAHVSINIGSEPAALRCHYHGTPDPAPAEPPPYRQMRDAPTG